MLRALFTVSLAGVVSCGTQHGTHDTQGELVLSSRTQPEEIPGYTLGGPEVAPAPITLEELGLIKKSLLFTAEDEKYLRISRGVLEPHVEELVGVWYGFVGANPHLLASFSSDAGEVDSAYLERVRARFERWVLDTASAEYDQDWLDYQFEIGRRHHRVGKNETDNARAEDHVKFRYIQALTIPVTTTLRPFLEKGGHSTEEVEKMHAAWVKSVTLQAILWSYPYVKDGDF
ncbi:MAG: protogloblin ApPgb [Phycisphaera sp.]|nr:MAG: protogloblin ApPgb [Phycisphaera sp.]